MKKQQNIYGEMKVELQRRHAAELEARERSRQMRAGSQDRVRDSGDEKQVWTVAFWRERLFQLNLSIQYR
jgi:hypothetical protein